MAGLEGNNGGNESFIPEDVKQCLKANGVPEVWGGIFYEQIADAFKAQYEKEEDVMKIKMNAMYGKMISAAEVIPFTKFIERFRTHLEGKGVILEENPFEEDRYIIQFRLTDFESSDLYFDIQKQSYGDYVQLPNFNLPEDMKIEDKYRLCVELKDILEACQTTN